MFFDKGLLFGTAFFFFGRGFPIRTSRVPRAISSTLSTAFFRKNFFDGSCNVVWTVLWMKWTKHIQYMFCHLTFISQIADVDFRHLILVFVKSSIFHDFSISFFFEFWLIYEINRVFKLLEVFVVDTMDEFLVDCLNLAFRLSVKVLNHDPLV